MLAPMSHRIPDPRESSQAIVPFSFVSAVEMRHHDRAPRALNFKVPCFVGTSTTGAASSDRVARVCGRTTRRSRRNSSRFKGSPSTDRAAQDFTQASPKQWRPSRKLSSAAVGVSGPGSGVTRPGGNSTRCTNVGDGEFSPPRVPESLIWGTRHRRPSIPPIDLTVAGLARRR